MSYIPEIFIQEKDIKKFREYLMEHGEEHAEYDSLEDKIPPLHQEEEWKDRVINLFGVKVLMFHPEFSSQTYLLFEIFKKLKIKFEVYN